MATSPTPQERHDVFYFELTELCRKHGVTLSASQYDHLQLWDAGERDGPLYQQSSLEIMLRAEGSE